MTPEEQRALYDSAATPDDAAKLLHARGRTSLAALILTFRLSPRAVVSADLMRLFARTVVLGHGLGAGWFEPHERPIPGPEAVRQVEAAFLWLAKVFERYAAKQGPPMIDIEPPVMLDATHAEETDDNRQGTIRSGKDARGKRGPGTRRKNVAWRT